MADGDFNTALRTAVALESLKTTAADQLGILRDLKEILKDAVKEWQREAKAREGGRKSPQMVSPMALLPKPKAPAPRPKMSSRRFVSCRISA